MPSPPHLASEVGVKKRPAGPTSGRAGRRQAQPRIASAAVESIPLFEGSLKDLSQDFVNFVELGGSRKLERYVGYTGGV